MHTAYKVSQLIKLPLTIVSIKTTGDHLLVGTKQGHLFMYSVKGQDLQGSKSKQSLKKIEF